MGIKCGPASSVMAAPCPLCGRGLWEHGFEFHGTLGPRLRCPAQPKEVVPADPPAGRGDEPAPVEWWDPWDTDQLCECGHTVPEHDEDEVCKVDGCWCNGYLSVADRRRLDQRIEAPPRPFGMPGGKQ